MEGDPAGVDGRHTGRGGYDHSLACALFEVVEKGGLAGAGLACQENISVGVLHKIVGPVEAQGLEEHPWPYLV